MTLTNRYVNQVFESLKERNPGKPEFLQAVHEVLVTLQPVVDARPELEENAILERLTEPERMVRFRVPWADDSGRIRINRGYRVQFSSAIGPYKGGLRFHPTVNASVMQFLAFEQTLKNALTELPMGGAKGGSDFDPKGKSEREIMRFCQSFMTELFKYIGQNTDVPAGDIGVGSREIGYLFGQYKRLTNKFCGVLTGKDFCCGGSLIRKEATGYGLLYITERMMAERGDSVRGKRVVISGSGNVAVYAAEKASALGAKVVAMSDSSGCVYDPDGIRTGIVKTIKEKEYGRIGAYADRVKGSVFIPDRKAVFTIPCDIALPCATQNELDGISAKKLVENGVSVVAEGANMPATPEAAAVFRKAGVRFLPGKAANAGGVAVSGLEMSQNSMRDAWTAGEVESRLKSIMEKIFSEISDAARRYDAEGDYAAGANIAGFEKVADAMLAEGVY